MRLHLSQMFESLAGSLPRGCCRSVLVYVFETAAEKLLLSSLLEFFMVLHQLFRIVRKSLTPDH